MADSNGFYQPAKTYGDGNGHYYNPQQQQQQPPFVCDSSMYQQQPLPPVQQGTHYYSQQHAPQAAPYYSADAPLKQPYMSDDPKFVQQQGASHMPTDGHNCCEETFNETTGWRDLWCVLLWALHLVAVGVLLGFGFLTYFTGLGRDEDTEFTLLPDIIEDKSRVGYVLIIIGSCAVIGLALGYAWLVFMQVWPMFLVISGIIFSALLLFAIGALSLYVGSWVVGVLMIAFGFVTLAMFYFWRSRIKFATEMLRLAGQLIERFPAVVRVGLLGMVAQLCWIVVWATALTLVHQYSRIISIIGAIYLIFSFYWTSQVFKNVVHVTASGTVATWYFMEGSSVGMPSNPTLKSLKRATTTSLGSVCFGSLLIAILRTIRYLLRAVSNGGSNNIAVVIASGIAACIIGLIDQLVTYFNQYAFAQVAIYGKSYIDAAKATWALVGSHGMAAIINDSLVGNVMGMICFASSFATGAAGALIAYAMRDQLDGDYWVLFLFIGFFVGFVMVMTMTELVESAVIAVFVCFAEDPDALRANSPHVYEILNAAYQGHSGV